MKVLIYCPRGKVYLPFGKKFFIDEAMSVSIDALGCNDVEILEEREFTPLDSLDGITGVVCRCGNEKIGSYFSSNGVDVHYITGRFMSTTTTGSSDNITTHVEGEIPAFNAIETLSPDVPSLPYVPTKVKTIHVIIGIKEDKDIFRFTNAIACIEALNNQSAWGGAISIILVEDGPTRTISDQLIELADVYCITGSHDTVYNRSLAFNVGVQHANADDDDILCLMDLDILPHFTFIEECFGIMEKCDIAIPYFKVKYLTEKSSIWARRDRSNSTELNVSKFAGEEKSSRGGVILARHADYCAIGGHDEEFKGWGCEDDDFIIRAIRYKTVYRGNMTLCHMYHPPVPRGEQAEANRKLYYTKHPYLNRQNPRPGERKER